jgi:hypothetical protein
MNAIDYAAALSFADDAAPLTDEDGWIDLPAMEAAARAVVFTDEDHRRIDTAD